jgi:hypothetical protein
LELTKCLYYLLTWKWDRIGNPIPQEITEQTAKECPITITTSTGITQPIQQRNITESHKTLGVFKSISGNENDHFEYLLKKSNQYGAMVCTSQFNRRQTKTAYCMNYIPALAYSLASMCLSEDKLNKIQSQAIGNFLQKMGYEKLFPRAVVYGTTDYGGLGFNQLYLTSMCQKIDIILGNVNKRSSLGGGIVLNLGWLQLHSGISTPVLESFKPVLYIQPNWFNHIHWFLIQINAIIKIRGLWVPERQRKNDKIIMDEVLKIGLSPTHLKNFNHWRILFQANTISDISTHEGDKIRQEIIHKKLVNKQLQISRMKWPNQEAPALNTFHVWTQMIQKITQCSQQGTLNIDLGDWIISPHKYRKFDSLLHNNHQTIMLKVQGQLWHQYKVYKNHHSRLYYRFHKETLWSNTETNAEQYTPLNYPDNINNIHINVRATNQGLRTDVDNFSISDNIVTLTQYIKQSTMWQQPLLEKTTFSESIKHLSMEKCVYTICNAEAGIGIVTTANGEIIMTNKDRIPSTFNEINSYRAEAFGIATAAATYYLIQRYKQINNMPQKENS